MDPNTDEVTERAMAPEARNTWLEAVLRAIDELVIVFDTSERVVFANPNARRLFGDWQSVADWPAEAGFFVDLKTRCGPTALPMRQALDGAVVRQMELYFRPPAKPSAGQWQTFSASPVRDAAGAIVGAVLVSRDTTATRDAVAELLEQGLQVQLLQQISAAANASTEVDNLLSEALAAICGITGWSLAHVYLKRGTELVPSSVWFGDQDASHRAIVEAAMSKSVPAEEGFLGQSVVEAGGARVVRDFDRDKGLPQGTELTRAGLVRGVFVPISIDEEVIAVLTFFFPQTITPPGLYFLDVLDHAAGMMGRVFERNRDRAALENYAKQVQTLSLVDELTGLYNRRGFLTLARHQLRQGQRNRSMLHLIFADIDGMKRINDELGHSQGDAAIRDVAAIMRRTFRTSDILARLGGDEFVAVAVDTTREGAELIIQRFQELIVEHNAKRIRPYQLEVSLGATIYDSADPITLDELLKQADHRMYLEKNARRVGRGR